MAAPPPPPSAGGLKGFKPRKAEPVVDESSFVAKAGLRKVGAPSAATGPSEPPAKPATAKQTSPIAPKKQEFDFDRDMAELNAILNAPSTNVSGGGPPPPPPAAVKKTAPVSTTPGVTNVSGGRSLPPPLPAAVKKTAPVSTAPGVTHVYGSGSLPPPPPPPAAVKKTAPVSTTPGVTNVSGGGPLPPPPPPPAVKKTAPASTGSTDLTSPFMKKITPGVTKVVVPPPTKYSQQAVTQTGAPTASHKPAPHTAKPADVEKSSTMKVIDYCSLCYLSTGYRDGTRKCKGCNADGSKPKPSNIPDFVDPQSFNGFFTSAELALKGCNHHKLGFKSMWSCCGRLYNCAKCHKLAGKCAETCGNYTVSCYMCNACGVLQDWTDNCRKCGSKWAPYTCKTCKILTEDAVIHHCAVVDSCQWQKPNQCTYCGPNAKPFVPRDWRDDLPSAPSSSARSGPKKCFSCRGKGAWGPKLENVCTSCGGSGVC